MKKIVLYFLFFIIGITNIITAQDTLKKPVVALVLSGGTAKGLSHIGVIKTLEEIGIRPDIIVGTSMGSIVGGLYAMGYSIKDLEKMALTTDWYKYLSNDTDLRNINIEEKDDFEDNLFKIPIKKKKPGLGKGLVYGHELELYLNRMTYPAYKYDNFDQFPIKYRAISVDVLKAEKYVFKDGPLSTALRSSMSLPTILIPKKYEGKLLVDGGVLDNFGVDVALENGADIIIGCNVGRMNLDEEQLGSFQKLFWLITMFGSKMNYDKYKDSVNVLIEPPVLDLGTRFDKAAEIMQIGYNTAQKYRKELLAIKKKLDKYETTPQKDIKFNKNQVYPVSGIEIKGLNKYYSRQIKRYLIKKLGKRVSSSMIENEITDLYGSGQYAYINYHLEKTNDESYKIVFNFERLHKNSLGFGIHYSDQVDFGIVASLMSRNYILPNSKFKIKGRISKFPGVEQYFTKYYWDQTRFGIKQSFSYIKDRIGIYNGNRKLTAYNRNFIIPSLAMFVIQDKNTMWETGYKYKISSYNNIFSYAEDDIENATYTRNSLFLSYYYNSLDDKQFSSTGNYLKAVLNFNFHPSFEAEFENSENKNFVYPDYLSFVLKWKYYISFNNQWTIENKACIEYSGLDNQPFVVKSKTMGGMFPDNDFQSPFWGLPDNYLITANKFVVSSGIRYRFQNNIYFKTIVNFGITDDWKYHYGAGIAAIINTPIGPVNAGITKSLEYKYPVFHISIGMFR